MGVVVQAEARGNRARPVQAVAGRATGCLPGRTGVPASRAPNPHRDRTGARDQMLEWMPSPPQMRPAGLRPVRVRDGAAS